MLRVVASILKSGSVLSAEPPYESRDLDDQEPPISG